MLPHDWCSWAVHQVQSVSLTFSTEVKDKWLGKVERRSFFSHLLFSSNIVFKAEQAPAFGTFLKHGEVYLVGLQGLSRVESTWMHFTLVHMQGFGWWEETGVSWGNPPSRCECSPLHHCAAQIGILLLVFSFIYLLIYTFHDHVREFSQLTFLLRQLISQNLKINVKMLRGASDWRANSTCSHHGSYFWAVCVFSDKQVLIYI